MVYKADVKYLTLTLNVLERLLIFSVVGTTLITVLMYFKSTVQSLVVLARGVAFHSMGVPSTVSQLITKSNSHILSGFHSYSDVSVQGITFEVSSNITSGMVVNTVS